MKRILITLATLALLIPVVLFAEDWDNPENGLEDCQLTEAQRDQMHSIRTAHQKEMIDLRAILEKLEIDQREAIRAEDFSLARKLVDKIYAKRAEVAIMRIDMIEEISGVLTDEQKEIWRNRRPMFRGRSGPQRGRNLGPGHHPGMHRGMAPGAGRGQGQGQHTGMGAGQGHHHHDDEHNCDD
ncbi:MAG: Spy/CpxP family protein refolding chaperone [Candidatus Cloacimonetes bacterium]|nr:Spy/CpxP family protein refolding chaperone [Candidatus Cloacimonadota bacterium]